MATMTSGSQSYVAFAFSLVKKRLRPAQYSVLLLPPFFPIVMEPVRLTPLMTPLVRLFRWKRANRLSHRRRRSLRARKEKKTKWMMGLLGVRMRASVTFVVMSVTRSSSIC